MRRGTACFDADGVLADFESAFCKEFGSENRHLYSLEGRYPNQPELHKEMHKFVKDPSIYYGLPVIEGGVDFLFEFIERGYSVVIATNRNPICETATRRWLTNNGIPFMRLLFTKSKASELASLGQELSMLRADILVDDSPTVLEECSDYFINPLCWKQPWNEYFFPKVWRQDGKTVFQDCDETHEVENYWKEYQNEYRD